MAREELKWQNIDADDLPAEVKKSFDAMVEAEATFKADLEKLPKNQGHMPENKFPGYEPQGERLGVAFAATPRGEGRARSLKFKTKLLSPEGQVLGARPKFLCNAWPRAPRPRIMRPCSVQIRERGTT